MILEHFQPRAPTRVENRLNGENVKVELNFRFRLTFCQPSWVLEAKIDLLKIRREGSTTPIL